MTAAGGAGTARGSAGSRCGGLRWGGASRAAARTTRLASSASAPATEADDSAHPDGGLIGTARALDRRLP